LKKDTREKAEELFLQADGKVTNVGIAKVLQVHPLTIGRWKRTDQWESKLEERRKVGTKALKARGPRKKDALDKALKLFSDAGGNITNQEIAVQVGVSASSIANWKAAGGWNDLIQSKPGEIEERVVAAEVTAELLKTEGLVVEPSRDTEVPGIQLDELVAPGQIIQINRKMDEMLQRRHLTADEVADLARAKSLMLEAVMTYLAIVRCIGNEQHFNQR
jgi:hypothetical protein